MKKISFFLVIFVYFQLAANCQPCLPEGITFSSQAQFDNYQINYPGCTDIEGDVWIEEFSIKNKFNIFPKLTGKTTQIDYTINTKSLVTYQILLNGADLEAGVYFCILKTNYGVQTKKL